MTSRPTHPGAFVVLEPDEAGDLAHLLELIVDWLSHADDDTRADLAGYLNNGGHGALAAAGLLRTIELVTVGLHHQLKEQLKDHLKEAHR
jgi:hypothetical protein